jgi:triacylglycerol lipase
MLPHTVFEQLDAPIVLAHGLFGFTRLGVGPLTIASYFRGIPESLQAAGNRVLVTRVPPIAGIEDRARRLGEQILRASPDEPVHVIGHSMGGLDARRLLADSSWSSRVLSLTTIGTPHLGSTLADFAKLKFGRIWHLLTSLGIDPQGCLDVTRRAARRFHRRYPTPGNIPCFSIAGDPSAETVCWPLQRTHAALLELEGPNDGLVSVESANAFGTPLPPWPVDHLRQMNWLATGEPDPIVPPAITLYAQVVAHLASLGFGSEAIVPFESRS